MSDWTIEDDYASELGPLVAALSQFPEPGALETYLRGHSLLPNSGDEESPMENPLTAMDYIRELGAIYWFDAETGMFPNEHDGLLHNVALLSDMTGVEFLETPPSDDDDSEPYWLEARIAGKTYRQQAVNYGDWYDIDAVLTMLNTIAADQSLKAALWSCPRVIKRRLSGWFRNRCLLN